MSINVLSADLIEKIKTHEYHASEDARHKALLAYPKKATAFEKKHGWISLMETLLRDALKSHAAHVRDRGNILYGYNYVIYSNSSPRHTVSKDETENRKFLDAHINEMSAFISTNFGGYDQAFNGRFDKGYFICKTFMDEVARVSKGRISAESTIRLGNDGSWAFSFSVGFN